MFNVMVEFPQQGEQILSKQYTIRIKADDARRVAVSLDDGPWLGCRSAAGFWWYDWSNYPPGEHELEAKAVFSDGSAVLSTPRFFQTMADRRKRGGQILVNQCMTRRMDWIEPSATITEAAQKMKSFNIGSLAVCEGDRLVGIITDRDLVIRGVAQKCNPARTPVRDLMTRDPACCFEDQPISEVAALMETKKIRRVPVLDRDNRLIGIVSMGDFAKSSDGKTIVPEVMEAIRADHS